MNDAAKGKLILNEGDTLEQVGHRMKGTLQETDIFTYDVKAKSGQKIGSVTHTDHTAIKGFSRTQSLEQYDNEGRLLVDISWSGS